MYQLRGHIHKLLFAAVAVIWLFLSPEVSAAPVLRRVSGVVRDAVTKDPLCGVVLKLGEDYLWAVTGTDGDFVIEKIQEGSYSLKANYLGYVDAQVDLKVDRDIAGVEILMQQSSLALDEVVVTAQRPKDGLNTSHTLGRDALNHLQMSNMTDMAALLPGGKTVNPDLTSSNAFSLRSGGSLAGNAAFGTALEVDGVRMGNNAGMTKMSGVDTRSISVENIESVEVITGVPSAEYGDLNSGMVKINTKRGRTPLNATVSFNPRTYQLSASKGFDLQKDRGVLNASLEWARATKQLISPYESYTRRGLTLNYSNTFAKVLRLEAGFSGNIGGMNSKDDPDAFSGEYSKVRDNVLRANFSTTWLLNKSWITNLKFDAAVNYQDNLSHDHIYNSFASHRPAVHAEEQGYFVASSLPLKWFSDAMVDSKELDLSSSLKYEWTKRWNETKSQLKAGVQWKANGNVGQGEYYLDETLAADGFRPRSYSQYPFMHNVSAYTEEHLTLPLGKTRFELTAGLRMENVLIEGTQYDHMRTYSPRFNAKWSLSDHFSIRGGWGVTEKLPSFYILYPKQEYWDIQTFSFSHGDNSTYVYYTMPYRIQYNSALKWQRNQNSEIGIDADIAGLKISAVGFFNKTQAPYRLTNLYTPFSYGILQKPAGYTMPDNPQIKVDSSTGDVFVRGGDDEFWQQMETKVTDKTFIRNTMQDNGADMYRAGAELTVDFPEIKPLRTSFRVDANFTWTKVHDESQSFYYRGGSHTSILNRSYEFVGIYANGGNGNSVVNGKITQNLDANLTSITHIPEARLIITCRLEMALLNRSRNISSVGGCDYAQTITSEGSVVSGNIHDGSSYTAIWPVAYMDAEDGMTHSFTEDMKSDPKFRNLMLTSSNLYTFAQDGYGFYCSANLSITKEIGKKVSLSFFANNFTNSRPYVASKATGVGAIFTPSFYYGLTSRFKF
jgi:Outer membrane receptor for ferrienterochelin and colicins